MTRPRFQKYMDFPIEIRLIIMDILLDDAELYIEDILDSEPSSHHLRYLRICRSIYEESRGLAFRRIPHIIDMRNRKFMMSIVPHMDKSKTKICSVRPGDGPNPLDRLIDRILSLRPETRSSIGNVVIIGSASPNVAHLSDYVDTGHIVSVLINLLTNLTTIKIGITNGRYGEFGLNGRFVWAHRFKFAHIIHSLQPFAYCNIHPMSPINSSALWAHYPDSFLGQRVQGYQGLLYNLALRNRMDVYDSTKARYVWHRISPQFSDQDIQLYSESLDWKLWNSDGQAEDLNIDFSNGRKTTERLKDQLTPIENANLSRPWLLTSARSQRVIKVIVGSALGSSPDACPDDSALYNFEGSTLIDTSPPSPASERGMKPWQEARAWKSHWE